MSTTLRDHPTYARRAAEVVAGMLGIRAAAVLGGERGRHAVHARHVVAYALRKARGRSYPEIGRELGYRDHTTVMHACAKVEGLLEDPTPSEHMLQTRRLVAAAIGAIGGSRARLEALDDWWARQCAIADGIRRSA